MIVDVDVDIILNHIIEYFYNFVDLVYSSLVVEELMVAGPFCLIDFIMSYYVGYYVVDVMEVVEYRLGLDCDVIVIIIYYDL